MRKVYEFHQLRKKAKQNAAKEVYNIEQYEEQDWSIEWESTTEYLQEILKEEELEVGEIYWDTYYGISIDLTSVSMTDSYLKKILTEEQYELYQDLEEISGGYLSLNLFDKEYDKDGFVLQFDYASAGFEHKEGMEFIMKYSNDEDLQAKYKLPLLLETELSGEEYEEMESALSYLGSDLAEELTEVINCEIEKLVDKLKKVIRSQEDYLGSEEYFYDCLDNENYLADNYLFNYQGEIVMCKGNFVECEYEEIYHDAA